MNKVENTNIYTSIKDQANLPRYFRRIFKILLNLKVGSIEVKLPDERIFKVYGENNGIDARVDIIDPDCFARLVRDPVLDFFPFAVFLRDEPKLSYRELLLSGLDA